jgi:hypothetical protein
VILSFVSRFGLCRRAGALVLAALATVAYGCGSSEPTGAASAESKGLDKQLNREDLYRYEGTGTAKRKVEIPRRERVKLLHDAANKAN